MEPNMSHDKTDDIVARIKAEGDAQVVAEVCGRRVTRGELSAAFDKVRNSAHWKNRIDAKVRVSGYEELQMIVEAIEFFTGSRAEVSLAPEPETYHVRAVGYFAAIGS
jgi:hypothetical protein